MQQFFLRSPRSSTDPQPDSPQDALLFASYYAAENPKGAVLFCPPFADEQNKSRRMLALQARQLQLAGYSVLHIDLSCTGDSSGDFADACWNQWLDELTQTWHWLASESGHNPWFLGMRLGGLFALQAKERLEIDGHAVPGCVLWQPQLKGKNFLAQFFRLRLAAGMFTGKKESMADLRVILSEQGQIEVAGYCLNSKLVEDIEAAAVTAVSSSSTLHWFELVANHEKPVPPASSRVIDSWQEAGAVVTVDKVVGEGFWLTPETTVVEPLLSATTTVFESAGTELWDGQARTQLTRVEADATTEKALSIQLAEDRLTGVLHKPTGKPSGKAVLIVVGGPQYRVGSQRQFVSQARALAAAGHFCLRFDYRGMGDATGDWRDFSVVADDIHAALNALADAAQTDQLYAWGLCDAAAALAMQAPHDPRLRGMVLLNPWVRSEANMAKSYLQNYYLQRLTNPALWRKVLTGQFGWRSSIKDFLAIATGRSQQQSAESAANTDAGSKPAAEQKQSQLPASSAPPAMNPNFLDEMAAGWRAFNGDTLVLLSGRDFVANEFLTLTRSDKQWRRLLRGKRVETHTVAAADHTFSTLAWRGEAEQVTLAWLSDR